MVNIRFQWLLTVRAHGQYNHRCINVSVVNCLYRDKVRVSGRVRVWACHPDSSGNLLTGRKMEFTRPTLTLKYSM